MTRRLLGARGAVRASVLVAGGVAASAIAVGVALGGGGGTPAPTGSANLFIEVGAGACTRSATPVAYVDSASPDRRCGSFDQAFSAAASSDTIRCRAGTYPAQDVLERAITGVQFIGDDGCTLRELDNWTSFVTFDNVDVDGNGTANNTFENHGDDTTGTNVTFKNASLGNLVNEKAALVAGANFTFDNVLFHDAIATVSDVHMECAYMIQVKGLVVKNSTFQNCAIFDMTFTYGDWWIPQPAAYNNVLIENNVFGCARLQNSAGYHPVGSALHIGANGPAGANQQLNNWDVRYNSLCNTGIEGARTSINSEWVGNVGGIGCVSGATYRYNVGETCGGSNSVTVSPSTYDGVAPEPTFFISEPLYNFRLSPGSPGINAGDPTDFPAADHDGAVRSNPPDAGAYEFG